MIQRKTCEYTQKNKKLVYMHIIFKPAYTKQAFEGKMRDPDQRICVSLDENVFIIHKAAAKTPKIH